MNRSGTPKFRSISRRHLIRGAAGAVLAVGALDAFALEPRWIDVVYRTVTVPDLASDLEGFLIAQLTDVHLTSIGLLHRAIGRELQHARPDLVVVTGDVIDADAHLGLLPELCSFLRAGGSEVVATLGNWEHWGHVNLESLASAYARGGARLLENESIRGPRGLTIVATDDGCSGYANTTRAFRDAPADRARLLLTHAPGLLEGVLPGAPKAALALSGHTHGGQISPAGRAVVVPPGSGRFVAGSYETPTAPLYVSRGIGTSLVPARFCCRPELPFFRLTASGARGIHA